MSAVVCIGSLNVDLVVRVARMPDTGETVTGHALERHLGGKGLNQALAARRAGGDVALVGAVGSDDGDVDACLAVSIDALQRGPAPRCWA